MTAATKVYRKSPGPWSVATPTWWTWWSWRSSWARRPEATQPAAARRATRTPRQWPLTARTRPSTWPRETWRCWKKPSPWNQREPRSWETGWPQNTWWPAGITIIIIIIIAATVNTARGWAVLQRSASPRCTMTGWRGRITLKVGRKKPHTLTLLIGIRQQIQVSAQSFKTVLGKKIKSLTNQLKISPISLVIKGYYRCCFCGQIYGVKVLMIQSLLVEERETVFFSLGLFLHAGWTSRDKFSSVSQCVALFHKPTTEIKAPDQNNFLTVSE